MASKPHILFVLADDYGWNDIGYHQTNATTAHPIRTPTLDALAASGVKLENYYVQPLCSPTRGTIMSGRYPMHTGLGPRVIKPATPYGLPPDEVTMAEHMQAAGYTTAIVGKWHLGMCDWRFTPTFRGFDSHTGYLLGAEDYFEHTRADIQGSEATGFSGLDFRNTSGMRATPADASHSGEYSAQIFAKEVSRIVQHAANASKPLFVYMPFQSVHSPLQVPESYVQPYMSITSISRRKYSGMVAAMDEAVLNITEAYKDAGMWEDTLMIFSTDNGGPLGSANNFPLRGHKCTVWEGGVRGVSFVRGWGLEHRAGEVSYELMHSTDWLPTLVHLATGGLTADTTAAMLGRAQLPLDGYDIWDVLASGRQGTRTTVVHNVDGSKLKEGQGAFRMGHIKLLVNTRMAPITPVPDGPDIPCQFDEHMNCIAKTNTIAGSDTYYLYNVTADPYENHDLKLTNPDLLKTMLAEWTKLLADAVTPLETKYKSDPAANPKLHADKAWGPWTGPNTINVNGSCWDRQKVPDRA